MLLKGAKDTDAFGARKNEGRAVEDVVITFTPGLSEKGEDLLSRKKEREHKKDLSVWEQYQDKRAAKRKEKGRLKEAARKAAEGGGEEDQPFSDDEVPDGVALAVLLEHSARLRRPALLPVPFVGQLEKVVVKGGIIGARKGHSVRHLVV